MSSSMTARFMTDVSAENVKRGKTILGIGRLSIGLLFSTSMLIFGLVQPSRAYTVITVSTSTDESTETALIAQTTTQFNASLFVNPFTPNTYQVKLFGLNPNYNPPPTVAQIEQNTVQFEYASGMIYERSGDAGALGYFMSLCDNATNFALVTIDSTTCQGVLGFMDQWIVTQTSGVAVLPDPLVGL
jgi:hypothetical protein